MCVANTFIFNCYRGDFLYVIYGDCDFFSLVSQFRLLICAKCDVLCGEIKQQLTDKKCRVIFS